MTLRTLLAAAALWWLVGPGALALGDGSAQGQTWVARVARAEVRQPFLPLDADHVVPGDAAPGQAHAAAARPLAVLGESRHHAHGASQLVRATVLVIRPVAVIASASGERGPPLSASSSSLD